MIPGRITYSPTYDARRSPDIGTIDYGKAIKALVAEPDRSVVDRGMGAPESVGDKMHGQELRIGFVDKDLSGTAISGVFIEIDGKRFSLRTRDARRISDCVNQWADYADGKRKRPGPKSVPYDTFKPLPRKRDAA